MPEMDGIEVLSRIHDVSPETPVIVASGTGIIADAIEALRLGACDYLLKPVEDLNVLLHAVEKSLERSRLIRENQAYQQHLEQEVERRTRALENAIDELRETNIRLQESETKYRDLFENIADLIIITEDKTGRILDCNQAAVARYGYTRKAFLDLYLEDLYAEGPPDRFSWTVAGECADTPMVDLHIDQAREPFPVEIHASFLQLKERRVWIYIVRDISKRVRAEEDKKALEAQLLQAHKLEAIGTLAGGIAHDFNNILSAVIGYAEIAGLELSADSRAGDNLKKVIKAGERAKDLVGQILSFSRQAETKRQPMQVAPVIEETLKLMRASLPATIEIRKNIENDADTINANATQIHQILMNLCTNAAYAMQPAGGVLEVALSRIEVDQDTALKNIELTPGAYLQLSISDTGIGMTPEVLERIFTPYFTTRTKGAGTGLGLSVVHGIVKSHGGAIAVKSKPGEGTCFTTYLPCPDEALESGPEKAPPELQTGSGCVLFVDDEATLVEIAGEMLTYLGYEAVTATDSREALKRFSAQPERFDLVITDMTMPGMTGDVLSRELLQIRPGIPILLCSGYSEESAAQKARDIGIRGFVTKPITMTDLAGKIKAVLDAS
jgi:PAS domain S-box-containing protein